MSQSGTRGGLLLQPCSRVDGLQIASSAFRLKIELLHQGRIMLALMPRVPKCVLCGETHSRSGQNRPYLLLGQLPHLGLASSHRGPL